MDTIVINQPLVRALAHVNDQFGTDMTWGELRAAGKKVRNTSPRFYAIGYLYATGRHSLSQIGRWFRLHHTSVLHARNRAHELWGKQHFVDLVLSESPVVSVTHAAMMARGDANMSRFVNGEGWA